MKFCTTCGRTYEDPAVTVCPHDGTPLFGMAGDEDNAGGGEAVESADAVEAAAVDAPVAAHVEPEPELPASIEDDLPAPVEEVDDDVFPAPAVIDEPVEEDPYEDLPAPSPAPAAISRAPPSPALLPALTSISWPLSDSAPPALPEPD